MMHMVEHLNVSCADAGSKYGVTKNVVIGVRHRTRNELAKTVDLCKKPENQNNGMPQEWWR
jgi:low affinity Fe/Cu permease